MLLMWPLLNSASDGNVWVGQEKTQHTSESHWIVRMKGLF